MLIKELPDFKILEKIASSNWSYIYKAEDLRDNTLVAIKSMRPGVSKNKEKVGEFLKEAELLISEDFRNHFIINVRDLIKKADKNGNKQYFMVMDYVGRSLRDVIEDDADLRTRIDYCIKMCQAFDYIHSHGIVHKDIKPENILINPENEVKIIDFGLAQLKRKWWQFDKQKTERKGTLKYMAPEQILGKEIDQTADIYSIGVTMYELFTKAVPFEGISAEAITSLHLDPHMGPRSPRNINPRIPVQLENLIMRSIETLARNRPQSCMEIISALRKLQSKIPGAIA